MANPSVQVDDEVLDDFDEVILQKQARGELSRDLTRSDVIRQFIYDYIEEHEDYLTDE